MPRSGPCYRHRLTRACRTALLIGLMVATSGCGIKYAQDDGRRLDDKLVSAIRATGNGLAVLRPAIEKSSRSRPAECERQWELPFVTVSSEALTPDEKVAWVRFFGVDERPTVVGAAPGSSLSWGEKITRINRYSSSDGNEMQSYLLELRDLGAPFIVTNARGKRVSVEPFEVCRGRVRIAPRDAPDTQNYHWLESTHPLPVFSTNPSADEALWIVLWTQGLSETAGARMKAYHYAYLPLRALIKAALLLNSVSAIAKAAEISGAALANQAGSAIGGSVLSGAAQTRSSSILFDSSKNREALEGVSWVAGTQFEEADAWALERILELGANPAAAIGLHHKLTAIGHGQNAFVFDEPRLHALQKLSDEKKLNIRWTSLLDPQMKKPADENPLDR